jgi:hypothetical protein
VKARAALAAATRAVETQAQLAELAKLTPARVGQIMNLLGLAPDIQEEQCRNDSTARAQDIGKRFRSSRTRWVSG